MSAPDTIVIGVGPAGLTANLPVRAGREVTVPESDPRYVDGIARTEEYRSFRFDIGGHRSFRVGSAAPGTRPRSFEVWVTCAFGARLYQTFFKTYTEKIRGMSCREISADWAAQRIKWLSLRAALAAARQLRHRDFLLVALILRD